MVVNFELRLPSAKEGEGADSQRLRLLRNKAKRNGNESDEVPCEYDYIHRNTYVVEYRKGKLGIVTTRLVKKS